MRLKLVRSETNFDFFSKLRLWVGLSLVLLILSLGSVLTQGLNFGIDFLGGTTIRTQSPQAVDVGAYRDSLSVLDLGDVSISEIFDPNFDDDQHVAMIRIQQQSGDDISVNDVTEDALLALKSFDPNISFVSVESFVAVPFLVIFPPKAVVVSPKIIGVSSTSSHSPWSETCSANNIP